MLSMVNMHAPKGMQGRRIGWQPGMTASGMDIEHAMDGNALQCASAGLHLQDALRRLDELYLLIEDQSVSRLREERVQMSHFI
jgi:hypothetical protein